MRTYEVYYIDKRVVMINANNFVTSDEWFAFFIKEKNVAMVRVSNVELIVSKPCLSDSEPEVTYT